MRAIRCVTIVLGAALATGAGSAGSWAAADEGSGAGPQAAAGSAADLDRANLEALLDKPVVDSADRAVGKVQDVILDPRGSQAKMLVVRLDSGKQVAVPFPQAGYQADRGQVRLIGMGEEDLAALTDFRFDDTMVSLKKTPPGQPKGSTRK